MKKASKKSKVAAKGAEKKVKSAGSAKKAPVVVPVLDQTPVDQLKAIASKAKASIAYVRGLFPKLSTMTEDERKSSNGQLDDDEESAARAIVGAGAKSEQPQLKDRLERRAALLEVAAPLQKLLEELNDTALRFGELVRPALSARRGASEAAE